MDQSERQAVRGQRAWNAAAVAVVLVALAVGAVTLLAGPTAAGAATQAQTDRELQARHDALVRDARSRASAEANGAAGAAASAAQRRAATGASSTAGRAGNDLSTQWKDATREANRPHPFDGSHTRLFALLVGLGWLGLVARRLVHRARRSRPAA